MKKVMKSVEQGMKMRIVGSDIKLISLNEGDFGETDYLDRVETPGIIEVVSPEEGIFEFDGRVYQMELLEGEDGSDFFNYAFEAMPEFGKPTPDWI
jgi:hypothetical protein|tara:strand:- start:136 stop:423 length:288 start_codon:yes stop_codon:yes gene_type:complete